MDVLRLDPVTYRPDNLIEGYSSMIWTERYALPGDFELRTSEVFPTMETLYEGALISLLDSKEVMIVEDRLIDTDDNGRQVLTIKGRSFETFLENRIQVPTVLGEDWLVIQPYTYYEIVTLLYWTHLVTASGEDVSRYSGGDMDTRTAIPNTLTSETINTPGTKQFRWLSGGEVYPAAMDFLALGGLGIRTLRPSSVGTRVHFMVNTGPTRGEPVRQYTSTMGSQIRFDIYDGVDRSRYQHDRPKVIFHYDAGHIDAPKYLFSTKDYRSMAKIASSIGTIYVYPEDAPTNDALTGLSRRTVYLDGGTKDEDLSDADFQTYLIQQGRMELKKRQKLRMFDGSISEVTPFLYGRDYFLGDKVSLIARLGFEEVMRVSEYVRTEDAEGDRGYPGLTSLTE